MGIKEILKFLLKTRHFVVFLAIVFLFSFGYSLVHQIKPAVDARAYEAIARNLVEIGEYRLNLEGPLAEDHSIVKVGPGYEFFLAGIYSVFSQGHWIIWLSQSLMFILTLILLGILIIKIFNREEKIEWKKFYFTIIPAAFFVDVIQLNAMLLGESLFIFLLSLALFIFYWNLERDDLRKVISLGLIMGGLYLVRPVALVVLVIFLITFLLKKNYKNLVLVGLIFAVIQVPWVLRNYQVYDKVILTHTTAGGVDLLSGNYPGNHGEFRSDFELYRQIEAESVTPIKFYESSSKWFFDFAKNNPLTLLLIWAEKGVIFWSMTKTGGFWFHYFNNYEQGATVLLSILSYILVFGTAIIYSLKVFREKFKDDLFLKGLVGSALLLMLVSVVTIISSRYRITLLPLALILSAGYWWRKSDFNYKYYLIAGGWLVAATALDLWMQYDKFLQKIGLILS